VVVDRTDSTDSNDPTDPFSSSRTSYHRGPRETSRRGRPAQTEEGR
jgi:hypothetical protein